MKRIVFLLLGISLLISSCKKDKDILITPPTVIVNPGILVDYEPVVIPIMSSVDGFVTDENGEGIQGALVKLGNKHTVTNEDGHFHFLNTDMNKAGTLVQVIASGYFDGSRRFIPTGNGVDRVRIQLLQKVYNQSFHSSTGGSITMPGSTGEIIFKQNSIIDSNGDSYAGIVDVAIKYLDPTSDATNKQMPGDLFGISEIIEEHILTTFGMFAVELVDGNGNHLNLAENSTAMISMPIPASMQGNAPTTIPLWYYDEQYGVWVEDGEATLANGVYIGEVTHFSWWNCNIPGNFVILTATLSSQNGYPLSGYKIKLTSPNNGARIAETNHTGTVSGIIPAGVTLVAEIIEKTCNSVLHTQNIGPFTNQYSTVSITSASTSAPLTTVAGSVECGGIPLTDYMLVIDDGTLVDYIYFSSPNFNWSAFYCGQSINYNLKVINIVTLQESNNYTIVPGVANGIGLVDACQSQATDFLSINVDGVNYLMTPGITEIKPLQSRIHAHGQGGQNAAIRFTFEGSATGFYPNQLNDFTVTLYPNGQLTRYTGGLTVLDIIISGSTISGTFGGDLQHSNSGNIISVSGHFNYILCEPVTSIQGTATCSGSPPNELIIKLEGNNNTTYHEGFNSSNLDFGWLTCSPNAPYNVSIIDVNSITQSTTVPITYGATNNIGSIDACQTPLSEYISLNVDGTNELICIVADSTGNGATRIIGHSNDFRIQIEFYGNSTGSYPTTQNYINVSKPTNNVWENYSGRFTTLDVTTFNSTDVIGSFSGSVTSGFGNKLIITGSFDSDL